METTGEFSEIKKEIKPCIPRWKTILWLTCIEDSMFLSEHRLERLFMSYDINFNPIIFNTVIKTKKGN